MTASASANEIKVRHQKLISLTRIALVMGMIATTTGHGTFGDEADTSQGVTLKLDTSNGSLVVDIQDPTVTVSVEGNEVIVDGAGIQQLRLKPGDGSTPRTKKDTHWVTIERDGKTILRVKTLPKNSSAVQARAKSASQRIASQTRVGNDAVSTVDGLAFPQIMGVKKFTQAIISLGPLGKHSFADIPEQLWGQNYGFATTTDGTLKFNVVPIPIEQDIVPGNGGRRLRSDKKLNHSRQRVWLLVPEKGWGQSDERLTKGKPFDTRQTLTKKGWHAWRTILSHHALTDPNESENQVKWAIFYKDVGPGETHEVRTHASHTPLLVWGSLDLGGVIVEPSWDQRVATFQPGVRLPLGNGHHVFDTLPKSLSGRLFNKRNGYLGITRFTVKRDQVVTVGFYDWLHMYDGNASGGWHDELITAKELQALGWEEVATIRPRHSNPAIEETSAWHFYSRQCKRGESFAFRNHKYAAPIVLAEIQSREDRPHPEGLKPRLDSSSRLRHVSAESIDLGAERVITVVRHSNEESNHQGNSPRLSKTTQPLKTGEKNRDTASTVFSLSHTKFPIRDLDSVVDSYVQGAKFRSGAKYIVGKIPNSIKINDVITVERFERVGNQIRLVFKRTPADGKQSEQTENYQASNSPQAKSVNVNQITKITQLSDIAELKVLLEKNAKTYDDWLANNAGHKDVHRVLLAAARTSIRQAEITEDPSKVIVLQGSARKQIATARNLFEAELAGARAKYSTLPEFIDPKKEPKKFAARRAAMMSILAAEIQLATATYTKAHTYAVRSQERVDQLQAAAIEFEATHKKYRSQMGGLYARLWHGRCLREAGDTDAAGGIFHEILKHPQSNAFRSIRSQALQQQLIIWNDNDHNPKQVIAMAKLWIKQSTDSEKASEPGAAILVELARAVFATETAGDDQTPFNLSTPIGPGERDIALRIAHELFESVAKGTGPLHNDAQSFVELTRKIMVARKRANESEDDAANRDAKEPKTPTKATLYFQTPIQPLPAGEYKVTATIYTRVPNGEKKLVGFETISTEGTLKVVGTDSLGKSLRTEALRAMLMKESDQMPNAVGQAATGLKLEHLLSASGQLIEAKAITQQVEPFRKASATWRQEDKKWAICQGLENPNIDIKIIAAKELAKLKDPDTAFVLLAAAKQNNFGVDGSENSTLHSIYRSALKEGLEATTGLPLTPNGLTFTTTVNGVRKSFASDQHPNRFPEDVDFRKVENWIRSVFIPQPTLMSHINPERSMTGLLGRAQVDAKDANVLFHYPHGEFFDREQLPVWFHDSRGFAVTLDGYVDVPRDMIVKVWLAGGGVSHDVNYLYIDGRQIGSTGDNRGKNFIYEVPLLKGLHRVRWTLTGGTFRCNVLAFVDPESGELMRLINEGPEKVGRANDEQLIKINKGKRGWPIPENWLPKAIESLNQE